MLNMLRTAALGFAVAAASLSMATAQTPAAKTPAPQIPSVGPDAALIQRGEYVSKLGDCAACHTALNGSAYSGGLQIKSPVGTIYSTNITPDVKTGIGSYSLQDFSKAIRQGVRKDGATLYPAMPYPEFSRMSDDDVAALYAYFMHGVQPVAQADKAEGIPWPLSIRWFVGIWRELFAPHVHPYQPAPGTDAEVARGEYIVTGPGHCGACHTQRGFAMQEKAVDARGGAVFLGGGGPIDNWVPISLRDDPRLGLGRWSQDDIVAFLKFGRTDHAAVFGGMVDVVAWSTSQFTEADLHAVAKYLKSLPPVPAAAASTKGLGQDAQNRGATVYQQQCALCHQNDGSGVARMFPPLAGDPVLLSNDPTSLMNIVLNGAILPPTNTAPSSVQMPGFRDQLSNQQVADVINYVRTSWGNQAPANVTASAVQHVRKAAEPQTSLGWLEFAPQPYGAGWTFSPQTHGGVDQPQ